MAQYTVRVFKSWMTRDDKRRWSNTYEVQSDEVGPEDLTATVDGIVAAEKNLHLTSVQFLSATVSTWEPDGTPYNPFSFYVREISGTGSAPLSTLTPLDANVCLMYKYGATVGRSGRRFYRGCLAEENVQIAGDATFVLTTGLGHSPGGAIDVAFRAAMAPYLSPGADPDKIVLINETTVLGLPSSIIRPVTTLSVGGVVINKRNHRYFDRLAA